MISIDCGIMFFSRQYINTLVVGYVHVDNVMDLDDRKSTIDYVFTLGRGTIYWKFVV